MGEIRLVENRHTLSLEAANMYIREGATPAIVAKVAAAEKRHNQDGGHVVDVMYDALDSSELHEGSSYSLSLGKRATRMAAIATFTHQVSPVDQAQRRLDYKMYADREGRPYDDEYELAFLYAIHKDLRDGVLPYHERYSGAIWADVAKEALHTQSMLSRVGYEKDGTWRNGLIMVHP